MGPLGAHFRTGYSLSEREREITVVIITPSFTRPIRPTPTSAPARPRASGRQGRGDAVGLPTSFDDTREQIVYEMAICLSNSRWVSKGLYDRAVAVLVTSASPT